MGEGSGRGSIEITNKSMPQDIKANIVRNVTDQHTRSFQYSKNNTNLQFTLRTDDKKYVTEFAELLKIAVEDVEKLKSEI